MQEILLWFWRKRWSGGDDFGGPGRMVVVEEQEDLIMHQKLV